MSRKYISTTAGLLTLLASTIVIFGWILDIPILKSISPALSTMKMNTALGFIFTGSALIFLHNEKQKVVNKIIFNSSVLLIIIIGGLSFLEYITNFNFGIDQLLINDTGTLVKTAPGRMSIPTAANFCLLGLAFLFFKINKYLLVIQILVVIVIAISGFALFAYILELKELFTLGPATTIALHTSLSFLIVVFGFLFSVNIISQKFKIMSGFVFALTISLLIGLILYFSSIKLDEEFQLVQHTSQVRDTIQQLNLNMASAQTRERGYALTGDKQYLNSFTNKIESVRKNLSSLKELTTDKPELKKMLADLSPLVEEKLKLLNYVVSLTQKGKEGKLVSVLKNYEGENLMEKISSITSEMQNKEDLLFKIRTEKSKAISANIKTITLTGGIISTTLLVLVFVFLVIENTKRAKVEEALTEKKNELDRYFTHTLDLLCIADQNGNFRTLNKAWETTLGYKLEYLEGKPYLDFVHPDDLDATLAAMADLSKNIEVLKFKNRYRHIDGSYRWIEWKSFPAGNLVYASARDITQRIEDEKKLIKTNKQLKDLNKELESFSYSVSHDLRAPLRHIDGFIDLLRKKIIDTADDSVKRYLDIISQASKKLGTLIDELLSYSRTGRQKIVLKEIDLNELVNEVNNELKPQMKNRKIIWEIDNLPKIQADYDLIKLVFQNLISNAIKFTSKIEEAIIKVTSIEEKRKYILSVKDNGAGFDMSYSDRLFGVFQRLHREDEFEGSGIGLANVRRIISLHNGEISANGKVNEGAEFIFTIPKKNKIKSIKKE